MSCSKVVKFFAQVHIDEVSCCSLINEYCNTIVEGHQISQVRFALSEAMLAVINHLLIFHVPLHIFQKDLLQDLAGNRGDIDWPVVPQVFLFILLKNVGYISPFPISGNFTGLPRLLTYDG